jgi:hypothetical protein
MTANAAIVRSRLVVLCAITAATVLSCAPTPPARPSPSTPSGQGVEVVPSNAEPTQTFSCLDPISSGDSVAAVKSGSPVLNVMALSRKPDETIGWGGASFDGFRFAKVGIAIRSRTKFDLVVPPGWQDKMRIGWGNRGYTFATTLHIPGCSAGQQPEPDWLVYPGGFWLTEPACAPLIIQTDTDRLTIDIPVGTNCP